MAKTNFTILCCGEIVGPFKDKMTLLSIVVAEDTCIALYLVMILSFLSAFGNKRSCMHMPSVHPVSIKIIICFSFGIECNILRFTFKFQWTFNKP